MTREELAEHLEAEAERHLQNADVARQAKVLPHLIVNCERLAERMNTAAAELCKTCATCQHFITTEGYRSGGEAHPPIASCVSWRSPVPVDGSGFCHRWEVKL